MRKKKGFTIVELLLVIGIIAILMGIITTAVSSSVKSARSQRATALCTLAQTALATYREQMGQWPSKVSILNNPKPRTNNEGAGGRTDPDKIVLEREEVRQCVLALIEEAKKGNPMIDVSGLFVADGTSKGDLNGGTGTGSGGGNENVNVQRAYGMDFMSAVRGTPQTRKKLKSANLSYGYPDPETGYFLRFKMVYSIPTDQLSVMKQR